MPEIGLHNYAPDGIVHPEYKDQNFWLSGDYAAFSTNTIRFSEIGPDFVQWLHNLDPNDTDGLAQEMLSITCVPQDIEAEKHFPFRFAEVMLGMKGTIYWASNLDPSDEKFLSPETREQMVQFALKFPLLMEGLKRAANNHPSPQLMVNYWQTYFPSITEQLGL